MGTVASTAGLEACTTCAVGRYMPYEGGDICFKCNYPYTSQVGSGNCSHCEAGWVFNSGPDYAKDERGANGYYRCV